MTVLFISIFLIYFFLVLMLIIGWNKALHPVPPGTRAEIFISVIIPVRNEEDTISLLLNDIQQQFYQNMEVIVVNDHSEDNTVGVVNDFKNKTLDNKMILLHASGTGKKAALTQGIQQATGTVMVTTDADCRVGVEWLNSIRQYFQDEKVKMVFGGVKVQESYSLFSKLQALEFISLMGSGTATWALGFPTMCSGANLAFRKSTFDEVGGYSGNLHIPSGDDEFLLRKIADRYPDGIQFMSDPKAVVVTAHMRNVKDFVHQRIRWAGKWRYHQGLFSKLLAILIFSFQLLIILLPLLVVTNWINPILAISLCVGKVLIEFFFLKGGCDFLKVKWNTVVFILWQLIYPFYVVLIGLASNIQSFEWKGRRLKSINTKLANH